MIINDSATFFGNATSRLTGGLTSKCAEPRAHVTGLTWPHLLRSLALYLGWRASDLLRLGAVDPEAIALAIHHFVFEWASQGFPGTDLYGRILDCYVILCFRLVLAKGRCGKESLPIWRTYAALSSTLGLYLLRSPRWLHQLRVARRCLPPRAQRILLCGDFGNPFWSHFVRGISSLVLGKSRHEAMIYVGVHALCKCWYLGKTSNTRKLGRVVWPGAIVRFREHFTQAFLSRISRDTAARYRVWHAFSPHSLCFFLCSVSLETASRFLRTTASGAFNRRHRHLPGASHAWSLEPERGHTRDCPGSRSKTSSGATFFRVSARRLSIASAPLPSGALGTTLSSGYV